jgi:hypothetical protein
MSAESGATPSEIEIFRTLTNPQVVNAADVVSRVIDEVQPRAGDAPQPRTPPRPSTPVQQYMRRDSPAAPRSPSTPRSLAPSIPSAPAESRGTSSVTSRAPPPDPVDKQMVLMELYSMKRDGVELSRDFTMDDSVDEMTFELNRLRAAMRVSNMASMATSATEFAMMAVEAANNKWGPVLHLDGWAATVSENRDEYRQVYTKLCKKHWRRGTEISPEMQLAGLVVGSAFANHLGHSVGKSSAAPGLMGMAMKMFGGAGKVSKPDPPAGAFVQRPRMPAPRDPMPAARAPPMPMPVPPAPQPSIDPITAKLLEENTALRNELHRQAIVAPIRSVPRIEELNDSQ